MSGAMTPRERAEAIEAVERRAAERGLRLERREQTGGEWVYDIRDEHGGSRCAACVSPSS